MEYHPDNLLRKSTRELSKESPVNNNLTTRSNQQYGFRLKNEQFHLDTEDKNHAMPR